MEPAELRTVGLQRLKSGEFPESVARDLRKQGLTYPELQSLFLGAAGKKRRRGFIWIALGVMITLAIALLVMGAMEAGFTCYGPGLAVGLFVIANGILQLKNAREIKRAVEVPQL